MLGLMDLLATAERLDEKEEIYQMLDKCVRQMDTIVLEIHRKINEAVKF
jgi:hypothetical protein